MLRHFLSATARTSSRSLFAKPNLPFSGGLNFFCSTACMSSRSLLVKRNTPVYISSLRSLSDQKLCASEKYSELDELTPGSSHNKTLQFTSIVPLVTREPDLTEWTRANMEFKMIDRSGSGMPRKTYFWSKTIVAPETMPKLKEILDELTSDGARVEESENYYFLEVGWSNWRKERFLELLMWLEEPSHKFFREEKREEDRSVERRDREEYAWSSGPRKPSSLPKPRGKMDQTCYMGV